MSRALPKELQTQKTSSLPDDLRSIAEELIADKFGIEEEVVTQRDDFFPPGFDGRAIDPREVFFDPRFSDRPDSKRRGNIKVEVEPWSRDRVARIEVRYPDNSSLVDAFVELDQEIPMRRERIILVGRQFFHKLMRDQRMAHRMVFHERVLREEGERGYVGEIYGFKIYMMPHPNRDRECYVEDRF